MTSLKARILEFLMASFRARPASATSRSIPQPRRQLSRQLSLGSSLAAYRASTSAARYDAARQSLQGACVAAIISNLTHMDMSCLPPDLLQAVLDGLIAAATLTRDVASSFRGLIVWQLQLGSYPGVDDSWLTPFASSELTLLDLGGCPQVTDGGLARLAGQTTLTRLVLDRCVVTDNSAATLAGFKRLRFLSMRSCERITLTTLACVGELTQLESLNLEMCCAVSGMRRLQRLKKLEHLDLGWCQAVGSDDVAAVAALTTLTYLELARTRASNRAMVQLALLTRLQRLGLAGTHIKDSALVLLSPLVALQSLDLGWCSRLTDAGVAHVAAARQLQDLNLAYCHVGDATLRHVSGLTCLHTLNLDSCNVSDRGLCHVAHLKNIRTLNLSENAEVLDGGLSHLRCLPSLESLDLSYTGVSDDGMTAVAVLAGLTHLNLDTRKVTDAGLRHLTALVKLKALDLFGARISDAGCAHLGEMKRLESLEVCGGGVTDRGVALLSGLTHLRSLSLAQNSGVGNESLRHIALLPQLCNLSLAHCNLSGAALEQLSSSQALTTLALWQTNVDAPSAAALQATLPALQIHGVLN